jgi:drug/metabolite transporter (DMT)-like permease
MSTSRHERSSGLFATSEGTHAGAFGGAEWGLVVATAGIWGSSYLWIDLGLRSIPPVGVTVLRLALGAATLALFPAARRRIERRDRGRIVLIGVGWMAVPMLAFPIAQQWVDSAIVGVLNAVVPLLTTLFASLLLRRRPGTRQSVGLLIGFAGLASLLLPGLAGADATTFGILLVVASMSVNAFLTSVLVPLQQRYGAVPVVWRAQLVALVVCAPVGVVALAGARPAALSLAAMIPLGTLSTGLAFVLWATLVGRAGASRGSVVSYVVPVTAVVLGVGVLGERLPSTGWIGAAAVVVGAVLIGGRDRRAPDLRQALDAG